MKHSVTSLLIWLFVAAVAIKTAGEYGMAVQLAVDGAVGLISLLWLIGSAKKQKRIDERIRENNARGVACCRKCGSTSITYLAYGDKYDKDPHYRCMNCGHTWHN